MFTWRHFVWILICVVIAVVILIIYDKRKGPPITKILTCAVVISAVSEFTKIFCMIEFVPSTNGTMIMPYLSLNHLPLHFCSIQIILICIARFTQNKKLRESLLAFMYPTCVGGAISAILMPSIFTTSIPVEKAFIHPMSYQFFFYHTMLFVLGIIIVKSGEVKWQWKHFRNTIGIVYLFGIVSIYLNSLFASPTYVDGELKSVDYWTNFFFTYRNPLGINITEIWQWYVYLAVLAAVATVLIFLLYLPVILHREKVNKR